MLDLFAGVGGLSTGLRQGDDRFRTIMAVEMEPRAAAGFRLNHEGAEVYDVPIEKWLSEVEVPDVDMVIGGPPCQGFSSLGARDPADPRNSLWRHYAETVRRAAPTYFVLENVPQFFGSPQYELFVDMTLPGGPLEDYSFRGEILNAADYGAAQIRKRVIVIGHRREIPFPGFPEPTHPGPGRWAPLDSALSSVGPLRALPPGREKRSGGKSFAGPYRAHELHVTRYYAENSLRRFAAIPPGGNRFDLPEELQCEAWKTHRTGSKDVMGRLSWDRPSVTIRTEFVKPEKGRYLHPTENRAITPYEGALIQGFPDDYQFLGPMTEIVKQIGNAVPIPLGKAVGRHLANHWKQQGPRTAVQLDLGALR